MKVDFKLLPSRSNNINIKMKPIYFMHIPKCGGTTVDNIFLKLSLALNSFQFKRFKYADLEKNEKFLLKDLNSTIPPFISGHLDYNFAQNIKNVFKCSIIRNPVDRIISHYKFQLLKLKLKPSELSFEQFISKEVNAYRDNLITRHFIGWLGQKKSILKHHADKAIHNINTFDKINIFENWDYFVADLLSVFGLPSVFYSKFQEHNYNFLFEPNKTDYDLIKKYYKYDLVLYNFVSKKFPPEFMPKKINYNKKICVVSPILETENKIFTPEQVKKLFQKNK